MSMIGYSQLMKDVLNIDKTSVELLLEKLAEHKLTNLRLRVLRQLAKIGRDTISGVLKSINENHTGGTYKSIEDFFESLKKEKILEIESVGVRSYWKFESRAESLANYLKNK